MTGRSKAFTLVELVVSIAVLTLLVLLFARIFNSTAAVTTSGNKRMDADSQARPLFERMATDFAQMVKRSDIDYYLKLPSNPQTGNDQIAFYSNVPGYYPSGLQSPISVVAYRIYSPSPAPSPCPNCNKLERMAKGLLWNGVSTANSPILFAPVPLASPSSLPSPAGTPAVATAGSSALDPDYELIGPYVFRFEYYYLLKNGVLTNIPWDTSGAHTTVSGMQDVAGISVCLAALDPKTRALVSDTQLATLTAQMNDFASSMRPGDLLAQWQTALNTASGLPRPAAAAVRLYERHFALAPKP